MHAAVGAHCVDCVKAAEPSLKERVQRTSRVDPLLVTKALIVVNVAVYLLSLRGGNSGVGLSGNAVQAVRWGVYAPAIKGGDWYRLFTAGFVHAGLVHVGFNSLAIYRLGQALESGIGRVRFLGIFLVAVVGGSVGALIASPGALTVGASGGAFGLMGAGAWAMRMRGYKFNQTGFGQVIVMNLIITFAIPQISAGGHVGGLLGGIVAAAIVLPPSRRPHPVRDGLVLSAMVVVVFIVGIVVASARG